MKKLLLFLLLFQSANQSFAQTKQDFKEFYSFQSIEVFTGYPYFFMNTNESRNYSPRFNFRGGVAFNKYFGSVKVSLGAFYSTKNYKSSSWIPEVLWTQHEVKYFAFPIIVSPKLIGNEKQKLSLNVGCIFLRAFNYSITTDYLGIVTKSSSVPVQYRTGISASLGARLTERLNGSFNFFSELNSEYKLKPDFEEYLAPLGGPPAVNYQDLTNDRFSINIQIGLEFYFRKRE